MTNIFDDQAEFMVAGGQLVGSASDDQQGLYVRLIDEEFHEFFETQLDHYDGDGTDEIKEAVDLIVVAAGFLISTLGVEGAKRAWRAVHKSNMAKTIGAKHRGDGKILQNAEYKQAAKAVLKKELEALVV